MPIHARFLLAGVLAVLLAGASEAQVATPNSDAARQVALRRATDTMVHLTKHEYDSATVYFSASLGLAITGHRLADTWAGLVSALGEPTGLDSARVDSVSTGFLVHVPVRFASMSVDATLKFDTAQMISAFGLVPMAKQR